MSKRPIFKDDQLQRLYDTNGVVQMPLLDEEQLAGLMHIFDQFHPELYQGMVDRFYFSTFEFDKQYRNDIKEKFLPLILPALDKILCNYKAISASILVKGIGENSYLQPHQDLTVVDEEKYYSCTVWIPLNDSYDENGTIRVLEGSHNVFKHIRAHTNGLNLDSVREYIEAQSVAYPVKPGNALIFDSAAIHYSPPNMTDRVRIALAVSVVTRDASVNIAYYDQQEKPDHVELYRVPEDFWQLYEDFPAERLERPAFGQYIGNQKVEYPSGISPEEFVRRYEDWILRNKFPGILKNKEWQQRLDEYGFLKMPFLDEKQLSALNDMFHELHQDRDDIPYDRLYTCLHNPDIGYRKHMHDQIKEVLAPALEKYFEKYQTTSFSFQIKGVGERSELSLHQDWSMTDDRFYNTYTFWIPLVDSVPANGTLYFWEKSHKFLKGFRGPGGDSPYAGREQRVKKKLKPLSVKAGELVLFDGAIAHYTPPNTTGKIRPSIITNILHADAPYYLFFGNPPADGRIRWDIYKVPADYHMLYADYKQQYLDVPPFAQKQYSIYRKPIEIGPDKLRPAWQNVFGKLFKWS